MIVTFEKYKCLESENIYDPQKRYPDDTVFVYIAETDVDTDSRYVERYMGVLGIKSDIEQYTKKFSIICVHYKKVYADILRVKNYTVQDLTDMKNLCNTLFQ